MLSRCFQALKMFFTDVGSCGLAGGGQSDSGPSRDAQRSLGKYSLRVLWLSVYSPPFPKELFKTHTWSCHSLAYDLANSSPAWPGQPTPCKPLRSSASFTQKPEALIKHPSLDTRSDLPALPVSPHCSFCLGFSPTLPAEKKKHTSFSDTQVIENAVYTLYAQVISNYTR